jgi:WD40 repeat protein
MNNDFFAMNFKYSQRLSCHNDTINAIELSPSQHFLATASNDCKILITHILSTNFSNKETIQSGHSSDICYLHYSSEHIIHSAGADSKVCVTDLVRGSTIKSFLTNSPCSKVSVEKYNGTILASTQKNLQFFDERVSYSCFEKIEMPYCKAEFRPHSNEFLVGSLDNFMKMYDLRNLKYPLFSENPLCRHFHGLKKYKEYIVEENIHGIADCSFNKKGSLILVNKHSKSPSIYRADLSLVKARFYCQDAGNLVTFKNFKFGGPNDSFILGGFDCKKVIYWKLSSEAQWNDSTCRYNTKNENMQEKGTLSRVFDIKNYKELTGFQSIINIAVMHPTVPLIFCGGIENALYVFSPFKLGPDDEIESNYDAISYTESWLQEIYRNV